MSKIMIGKNVLQPGLNYKAFIPYPFPPQEEINFSPRLSQKHTEAIRLLGKLDGIATLLPDKDLFLKMFIRKDAASSSRIEGTNATMTDSIEHENIEPRSDLPADVDDIIHYIHALNYGLKRAQQFPFSLRFVKELHSQLMSGARSTQMAYPGEFRQGQNWISGTRPDNAKFVPPPVYEMKIALGEWENFIHAQDNYLPLIKAGLLHAQFETIHPFNDGNGRTGRMIITMYLWYQGLLEMPILYLSSYFRQHQSIYYEKLNGYHCGQVEDWLDFFLDGIIETARSAIATCAAITQLREKNLAKVQVLNQSASITTLNILTQLYKMPIAGIADFQRWTGFTAQGTYKAIKRMIQMDILQPLKTNERTYAQKWVYKEYLDLFTNEE